MSMRHDSMLMMRATAVATLMPGWVKINLKESKIEDKKKNDFNVIYNGESLSSKSSKNGPGN